MVVLELPACCVWRWGYFLCFMCDIDFVCLVFLENQILIVVEYQFCLYFVLFFFKQILQGIKHPCIVPGITCFAFVVLGDQTQALGQ